MFSSSNLNSMVLILRMFQCGSSVFASWILEVQEIIEWSERESISRTCHSLIVVYFSLFVIVRSRIVCLIAFWKVGVFPMFSILRSLLIRNWKSSSPLGFISGQPQAQWWALESVPIIRSFFSFWQYVIMLTSSGSTGCSWSCGRYAEQKIRHFF